MNSKNLIKVTWFPSNSSRLNEIYQQTGMVFAFVTSPKENYKMCHEWVKCRDFLHDAVRSQITGRNCEIYGFKFHPGNANPPIDLSKMRMLVSKNDIKDGDIQDFKSKIKSSLRLLNHFERYAGVSLSRIKEVDPRGSGKKVVFLFISPVMWISSPFLVSMYSFLIRLGDKKLKFRGEKDLIEKLLEINKEYFNKSLQDNDAVYLGTTAKILHKVLKNRDILFPKKNGFHDVYEGKFSINQFHNNSGIRSLSIFGTYDKELNIRTRQLFLEI